MNNKRVDVRIRMNPLLYRIRMLALPPRATGKTGEEEAKKWNTLCQEVYAELVTRRYRPVCPAVIFICWHMTGELRDPDQVEVRQVVNDVARWGLTRNDTADAVLAVVTASRRSKTGEDETEIWVTRPQEAPETLSVILET